MNGEDTAYEFCAEFRGGGYTWFPAVPPQLSTWDAVFGWCLQHQVSPMRVDMWGGQTWAVQWSSTSRTQVRGGSLQFVATSSTEEQRDAMIDETDADAWMSVVMALVSTPGPWRLRARSWRWLQDPESKVSEVLRDLGIVPPMLALTPNNPAGREALLALREPGNYVVVSESDALPSLGGQLLLDYVAGGSWLEARIGPCQRPWLSSTSTFSDSLSKLDDLATHAQTKAVGWDDCERLLQLVSEIASRWSGAAPRWEVHIHGLALPEIDVVAGTVGVPIDARGQQLAMRAGATTSVIEMLSSRRAGGLFVKMVLALAIALAVGLVLGFCGGYVLGRSHVGASEKP